MAVSKEELRAKFVGKTLDEVPIPSVILDQAKLRVNCERMLDTVNRLGLGWRAHIKTHKVGFVISHACCLVPWPPRC